MVHSAALFVSKICSSSSTMANSSRRSRCKPNYHHLLAAQTVIFYPSIWKRTGRRRKKTGIRHVGNVREFTSIGAQQAEFGEKRAVEVWEKFQDDECETSVDIVDRDKFFEFYELHADMNVKSKQIDFCKNLGWVQVDDKGRILPARTDDKTNWVKLDCKGHKSKSFSFPKNQKEGYKWCKDGVEQPSTLKVVERDSKDIEAPAENDERRWCSKTESAETRERFTRIFGFGWCKFWEKAKVIKKGQSGWGSKVPQVNWVYVAQPNGTSDQNKRHMDFVFQGAKLPTTEKGQPCLSLKGAVAKRERLSVSITFCAKLFRAPRNYQDAF